MKVILALLTLLAASSATARCSPDGSTLLKKLPRAEYKSLCPDANEVPEVVNGSFGRCVDKDTCLPVPICTEAVPQCEEGCEDCVIAPQTRTECSTAICVDNREPYRCGDGSTLICRRGHPWCGPNNDDYAPVINGCYGECVDRLTCLPSPPPPPPTLVTKKCGVNEFFTACGTSCQPTCLTGLGPQLCNQACEVNVCACKLGFVRNATGACVTMEECPAQEEPLSDVSVGRPCCNWKSTDAECNACRADLSIGKYCFTNPDVSGCEPLEELPQPVEELPRACCFALVAECFACEAGVSVEEYCLANPDVFGCGPVEEIPRCAVTAFGAGCTQREPEVPEKGPCVLCTLAVPECEEGCEACEISRQTCTECSTATCSDEEEQRNFLLFLHKLYKQHLLKLKGLLGLW